MWWWLSANRNLARYFESIEKKFRKTFTFSYFRKLSFNFMRNLIARNFLFVRVGNFFYGWGMKFLEREIQAHTYIVNQLFQSSILNIHLNRRRMLLLNRQFGKKFYMNITTINIKTQRTIILYTIILQKGLCIYIFF